MSESDSAAQLEHTIERYNEAWNAHDVDAIVALHASGMVFENHTAAERVEGDDVRGHIARIFESWPDLAFRGRRLLEWDGVDIFPFENGLIQRKDVYSTSHRPRVLDE